jgi:hypothetical protein
VLACGVLLAVALRWGAPVMAHIDALQGWLAEAFTQLGRRWFGVTL